MDPKLVGNYTGIAIASFISGCTFYILFYKRDRIGTRALSLFYPDGSLIICPFVEEAENAIGKGRRYDSATTLTPDEKSPNGLTAQV